MQHDLEMIVVQLLNHRVRIGEHLLVERELAVVGVPAGRAEAGAEVDHRLARQLLLAERLRLLQDLLAAGERAMRLLIAERPQGRHLRMAGEPRVLRHDHRRVAAADDEDVDRLRNPVDGGAPSRIAAPDKAAFRSVQLERALRLMNEHGRSAGVHQPWHRHATAVGPQLITALAAARRQRGSAAIELRSTFAKAEDGSSTDREREHAEHVVDPKPLNHPSVSRIDIDPELLRRRSESSHIRRLKRRQTQG